MKSAIKGLLKTAGYEVRRMPVSPPIVPTMQESYYTLCVLALIAGLAPGRKLCCVQVGANDGKINDPLFDISSQFFDRMRLLLIEPQARLINYIKESFASHPDVRIEQVAIGKPGTLTLYGVSEDVWRDLDVPYANGWPLYRAPSGIVSGDREYVEHWLKKFLRDPSRAEDAIVRFDVESVTLESLVDGWTEDGSIDLLQIDTEGFDDRIIMSTDLDRLRPKLIFFEAGHLSKPRKEVLFEYLNEHGYSLVYQGEDVIALRVRTRG